MRSFEPYDNFDKCIIYYFASSKHLLSDLLYENIVMVKHTLYIISEYNFLLTVPPGDVC